jgi:hypothetical protein
MALTIGAPIDVPAPASASAIEEKRKELERSLEALAARAVRLLEE